MAKHLKFDGSERKILWIKILYEFGLAGFPERTVQIVSPGMVWANDFPEFPLACKQFMSPVFAHIVKGTQDSFSVSCRDDTLSLHARGHVASGLP
jgi:hypothetical protein